MSRLAINQLTTFRWSFEEDIHQYAEMGFGALSLWRAKVSDFGDEKALELLSEYRMEVVSLQWAGGFTGSEGQSFREAIDDAHLALQLASRLGAKYLTLHSGARAGHTRNHARRLLNMALEELLPFAEAFDVGLTIEPMSEYASREWTILHSLQETLDLVSSFDSPYLKWVLDLYHFGRDPQLGELLVDGLPGVGIVQLADALGGPDPENNRCWLGNGHVPLGPILSQLQDLGYEGDYEVELMGEEIERCDYRDLLRQIQDDYSWIIRPEQSYTPN